MAHHVLNFGNFVDKCSLKLVGHVINNRLSKAYESINIITGDILINNNKKKGSLL